MSANLRQAVQQDRADHFGGNELTDNEIDSVETFARAIELVHGIGSSNND